MDADQEQFLRDELASLALMATVQRAKVYKPNTSEQSRRGFHRGLRSKLEEMAKRYEKVVEEDAHVRNVVELSDSITRDHGEILNGGRFRIGTAQKALNLYLKYMWCLEMISQPPHCPFDYQIIAKLSGYTGPSWTALDREDDYRSLVASAKAAAKGVPLAQWELRTYNNAQPGAPADRPTAASPLSSGR